MTDGHFKKCTPLAFVNLLFPPSSRPPRHSPHEGLIADAPKLRLIQKILWATLICKGNADAARQRTSSLLTSHSHTEGCQLSPATHPYPDMSGGNSLERSTHFAFISRTLQ